MHFPKSIVQAVHHVGEFSQLNGLCHSVAQEGYGYLLKLKLWTLTKAMMTHRMVEGPMVSMLTKIFIRVM